MRKSYQERTLTVARKNTKYYADPRQYPSIIRKQHLIALTDAGDLKPMGYYSETAFSGLAIVALDDEKVFGYYFWGSTPMTRLYFLRRLCFTQTEEAKPYFIRNGNRYYLDEFARS